VPDGFVVELVAGPPLVSHPMMAGFDDRGRLYVADALGVNLNAEELQRDLPNRIQRLEDTDDDGRFDRATTFADKMTFPMGAVWHRGAIYTASPPYIWRLEDTDDDGVADRREQIVGKFGFIGNAADIHGCFIGPDGRIYWCDGRHGHEFVDANGETLSKGQAARIFSCKPDGSDVQVYAGGGMDNPVEIAFTAEGEILGTMTFYNPDEVRHDALVHYAYGGVYPRKHAVVEEFKRTGDFMPALSLYGTVAPAGLTRYVGTAFGNEYTNNFFSVQFNTHKVLRHKLTREGSSFVAEDEDFLTSPSVDFHPTDVLEDADGSLLVIDTGGWFRHGCPTSQIAKPEILGAIYRIRRAGAPVDDDPRGRHLPWRDATIDELALRLGDERPAVRERAVEALAQRGDKAVPVLEQALRDKDRAEVRQQAVWALARINSGASKAALRVALRDDDWRVRLSAVRAFSSSRDLTVQLTLEKLLFDESAPVRREAATALGRAGASRAVPALLQAVSSAEDATFDRHFEHSVIFALIEIGDHQQTIPALAYGNPPSMQRAALVALDQMGDAGLTSLAVMPLLDSPDGNLRKYALEVLGRHQEWSAEITYRVDKWLKKPALSEDEIFMLRGAVTAFAAEPQMQELVGRSLQEEKLLKRVRFALLESIGNSELDTLPTAWHDGIAQSLATSQSDEVEQALITVRATRSEAFDTELSALVRDADRPIGLRQSAACTRARPNQPLDEESFELLLSGLSDASAPLDRMTIATTLGEADLDDEQLSRLLEAMKTLGALEIPSLVRAFRGEIDIELENALLEVIKRTSSLYSLDIQGMKGDFSDRFLKSLAGQLSNSLAGKFNPYAVAPNVPSFSLTGGDATRGREVFHSNQAACAACHRIQDAGGQIGPDLSHIGAIRAPQDLLESVMAPSASFARGYETYSITTSDGIPYIGVIARETAAFLFLRDGSRNEVRISRKAIEEMERRPISIMPEGLHRQLTQDDLRDLIAYLSSLK